MGDAHNNFRTDQYGSHKNTLCAWSGEVIKYLAENINSKTNMGFSGTEKPSKSILFEGFKLGYKDSNLEMTESESVALPFGDSPILSSAPSTWI